MENQYEIGFVIISTPTQNVPCMKLYAALSKIGFLRNRYALKFLFVAFIGIHIPLIGLIFFLLFYENKISPTNIFVISLIMTLVATALTLFLLKRLIKPIENASKALENYRASRIIPNLPTEFSDAAGLLMSNIQSTIRINENLLTQKQELADLLSNDMKRFAETPMEAARAIVTKNPPDEIRTLANSIIDSSAWQIEFIQSYIKVLKEEEILSKKVFKVRSVNLAEIVNTIKRKFADRLQDKKIFLKEEIKQSDAYIRIDSESLISVISDLVDNAIKYSPEGGLIAVKIYREHSHLKISVSDSGAGIEGKSSNDLFKISNMTRSSKLGKSSGMSLYLSSQIIKKADGTFYAENNDNATGATFYVDLKQYRKK